jgi:glycosyltransferase involved in cell wall biosynthesis
MNIKIIFSGPYPQGMAASRRVHLYAKGISQLGHQVKILLPNPTEIHGSEPRNKESKGNYEGIEFIYPSGTTGKSKYFLKKSFNVLKGMLKAGGILIKERKHTDAVLMVTNALYHILFFKIVTKILKIKYLQEKSELPFINKKSGGIFKIYSFWYIKLVYKCFDGMLVISQYLYDYFKPRVRKKFRLLIVPIIVDPEGFISPAGESAGKGKNADRSIVYSGTLCEGKDGVLTLIKAFNIIAEKYKDLKLYLVGHTEKQEDIQKIDALLKQLKLEQRVILNGFVIWERLVELLNGAVLLALAKPSSRQAEACFPTKLAEYLATGNPVVVTKLGSIPLYLTDGENAFLSEPDSVEAFAQKMDYVLSHPGISGKVGALGRELAQGEFNYRTQTKRIVEFIESL